LTVERFVEEERKASAEKPVVKAKKTKSKKK
jgi:hypothetical protein